MNKDTARATSRVMGDAGPAFHALCRRIVAANNRRKRLMIGRSEHLPVGEIGAKIEIEHRTSITGGVFD